MQWVQNERRKAAEREMMRMKDSPGERVDIVCRRLKQCLKRCFVSVEAVLRFASSSDSHVLFSELGVDDVDDTLNAFADEAELLFQFAEVGHDGVEFVELVDCFRQ